MLGKLDPDPLDFIQRDVVGATIIELCRPRARVVCHAGCAFKGATVLEIGGDSGGAEAVVADHGGDACGPSVLPDHGMGAGLGQRGP